jgi:ABC-type uncharacterized transport system permease subunit
VRLQLFIDYFRGVWVAGAALAVTACLIGLSGYNPLAAYTLVVREGLLDFYGFSDILVKLSPLLLTSLAVAVPLRAGLYNIGAEGQMYAGAVAAVVPALFLPSLPPPVHVLACSICGLAGGAAWAALPGALKAYRGTNEVITTLLLNYVAINMVNYAVSGPLLEPGAPYPYSRAIAESSRLPRIWSQADAHYGLFVALLLNAAAAFILERTPFGFGLGAIGASERAAVYAGVPVRRSIVVALSAGGAMAGLAGAFEVMGLKHRLFHLFAAGYGYEGIVVAFLAGGRVVWLVAAAFFIATLKVGGNLMQRGIGIPVTVVAMMEGLLVLFVPITLVWGRNRSNEPDVPDAASTVNDDGLATAHPRL